VVLGAFCFLGAAWLLAQIDTYTGDETVLLLTGLLGLGWGTMLLSAQLMISFSERAAATHIPAGIVRRLAFVQLVRFTLS
jgi:hypothetical protein